MIRIEKLEKKRYKAVKVMEWFKMQSLILLGTIIANTVNAA